MDCSNKKVLSIKQMALLDVWRIIAASCVVLGHSFSWYQVTLFKDQSCFPYIQNIGVVCLFVLSGFLTVYSIKKKSERHTYTFSDFFRHKIKRIMREYIPALLFILIIDAVSIRINGDDYAYYEAFTFHNFIGNIFMLQCMGPREILSLYFVPFGSGRQLWTLSVEWWLYMLFGWLYLKIYNGEKIRSIDAVIGGTIIFLISEYIINGRGNGLGIAYAIGILAYYIYDLIDGTVAKIGTPLLFIIYILYGYIFKEAYSIYSFLIIGGLMCFLLRLMESKSDEALERNNILVFISSSTFMLYLLHYSVIDFVFNWHGLEQMAIRFSVGICLSYMIALIMYYYFGYRRKDK